MKTYIKENGTRIIFMLAVFSFLAVSIPHVAAIFRIYEPQHDGYSWLWWTCSLGAAAGIDILAGWLTLVMMSKEVHKFDRGIIWAFIIALMLFSWYCNWLFDMLNNPIPTNVWGSTAIDLPFVGVWTVQQITPLMVSALPVFIIAYASIAHLVGVKKASVVLSLAELKVQAQEASERAAAELTIVTANAKVSDEKIKLRKASAKKLFTWNEQEETPGMPVSEQGSEQEDETKETPAEIPIANTRKPRILYPSKQGGNAKERVYKVLKVNTDATISDIVNKAKVSRGYASRIRAQYLSEQEEAYSLNGIGGQ
jgi:hypothetical protein